MDHETSIPKKMACFRTKQMTIVTVVAIVFLCVSLALVIAVAVLASSRYYWNKDTCLSNDCIKGAASLLKSMNQSVDPCVDFYEFTCGNWIDDHKFLDPTGSKGILGEMQEKSDSNIKDIFDEMSRRENLPRAAKMALSAYNACMNDSMNVDFTALKELFNAIGGWPILEGKDWNGNNYNWQYSAAKLMGLIGIDSILSCYVDMDFKASNKYILMFDQPQDMEVEESSGESIRTKLLVIIKKITGHDVTDHFAKDIDDIEEIDSLVKEFSTPKEDRKNPSTMNNKMTLRELQIFAPKVDWIRYCTIVFHTATFRTHRSIRLNEEVLVLEPKYIRKISEALASGKYSNRAIANYIGWKAVSKFMFAIPNYKVNCHPDVHNLTWNEPTEREVNKEVVETCINKVTEQLSLAADHLVFSKQKDSDHGADELVVNIQRSFSDRLKQSAWIDEKSKKNLHAKVSNIVTRSGFPKWILNGTKLDEYYKDLPDLDSDNLNNFMHISAFVIRKIFNLLDTRPPTKEWIPTDSMRHVNAYYMVHTNKIVLPMSILSAPLFNKKLPWYLNYGSIGFIIGHELTHGFDDEGMKWDVKGELNPDWLPQDFRQKFEDRSQCFVKQFQGFSSYGMQINGNRTLGENIADSGGLIQSFEAYKNWKMRNGEELKLPGLEEYTSDQMFFIAFGATWCSRETYDMTLAQLLHDEHSPEKYRVIGSISNTKHFAEAFKCPVGSPMNPAQKCILW